MLNRVWHKLLSKLSASDRHANLKNYWRERARQHGKRSVLNIAHEEDQFEAVTNYQKSILFPLLKSELSGFETTALDFGCGPGRFTNDLAELIGGFAVGVDITQELLTLAPKSPLVSYQCIAAETLPFSDSSFDLVWACLVLGGIPDSQVAKAITEIRRVLRPGGLFFFVENTANLPNSDYWFYRNEDTYLQLAEFCKARRLGSYEDIGQTVTIFLGKKAA